MSEQVSRRGLLGMLGKAVGLGAITAAVPIAGAAAVAKPLDTLEGKHIDGTIVINGPATISGCMFNIPAENESPAIQISPSSESEPTISGLMAYNHGV